MNKTKRVRGTLILAALITWFTPALIAEKMVLIEVCDCPEPKRKENIANENARNAWLTEKRASYAITGTSALLPKRQYALARKQAEANARGRLTAHIVGTLTEDVLDVIETNETAKRVGEDAVSNAVYTLFMKAQQHVRVDDEFIEQYDRGRCVKVVVLMGMPDDVVTGLRNDAVKANVVEDVKLEIVTYYVERNIDEKVSRSVFGAAFNKSLRKHFANVIDAQMRFGDDFPAGDPSAAMKLLREKTSAHYFCLGYVDAYVSEKVSDEYYFLRSEVNLRIFDLATGAEVFSQDRKVKAKTAARTPASGGRESIEKLAAEVAEAFNPTFIKE